MHVRSRPNRLTHHRSGVLILIGMLLLLTTALGAEDPDLAALPLLEPGLHLGTTFYGSGDVPEDDTLVDTVASAAQQGMTAFTFYVDWPQLEPEPGVYALDDLRASLNWLHELGIQPLLNITLIDIDNIALPDDLLDLPLDDPRIVERLNGLLGAVAPLLVENGGFLLLLGNEVDAHFNDTGAPFAPYVRLIEAARAHVHTSEPQLAVGVTLTGTEVMAQGQVFEALRPVTDAIPFNYYPLSTHYEDWFALLPLDAIPDLLAEYMRIYGDDPVIIQELGCPSAEINASSLEAQAACFDLMFEELHRYPNVRYVTVFTLYDFDEPTCDLVIELFGITEAELPGIYFDRWRGYLCTLGLLYPDYSPKPAWDVFTSYLPG
ncbi:MAG: hypothetical protein ACOCYT_03140 [Chloroflexota bacterium]